MGILPVATSSKNALIRASEDLEQLFSIESPTNLLGKQQTRKTAVWLLRPRKARDQQELPRPRTCKEGLFPRDVSGSMACRHLDESPILSPMLEERNTFLLERREGGG